MPNAALRFKPDEASIGGDKKADGSGNGGSPPAAGSGGEGRGKGRKRDGSTGTVYLIEQGALKAVSVQLGITDNRHTEVVGGELKAGDKVIVGENVIPSTGKPSSVGMRLF